MIQSKTKANLTSIVKRYAKKRKELKSIDIELKDKLKPYFTKAYKKKDVKILEEILNIIEVDYDGIEKLYIYQAIAEIKKLKKK